MELDDYQTLRLVQEKIVEKVYAHENWPDFINWLKTITKANFKAFVLGAIDEILGSRDDVNTDLQEGRNLVEGS